MLIEPEGHGHRLGEASKVGEIHDELSINVDLKAAVRCELKRDLDRLADRKIEGRLIHLDEEAWPGEGQGNAAPKDRVIRLELDPIAGQAPGRKPSFIEIEPRHTLGNTCMMPTAPALDFNGFCLPFLTVNWRQQVSCQAEASSSGWKSA